MSGPKLSRKGKIHNCRGDKGQGERRNKIQAKEHELADKAWEYPETSSAFPSETGITPIHRLESDERVAV